MDVPSPDKLQQLLEASKAHISAEQLSTVIDGVAAAPGDDGGMGDRGFWMTMVAEKPSPDLADYLRNELEKRVIDAAAANHEEAASRLAELRAEMSKQSLEGFLVPLADEHQGEYVSKRARRLAWLTGFTGSAGLAIVLQDKAAMFVDGRYTLQADQQVNKDVFTICPLADLNPTDWLAKQPISGKKIGIDPWLHTADGAARLRLACDRADAELVYVGENLIDCIWADQPPRPLSPVVLHDTAFAGQSSQAKRDAIAKEMKSRGEDATVLTAPDSIAWLANIRGGDVPYTPLSLGFAILSDNGKLDLFMDGLKMLPGTRSGLGQQVDIAGYEDFGAALNELGKGAAKVRVDPSTAAEAVFDALASSGAEIIRGSDPCALPKACKNSTELEGTRKAHLRDGVALSRFLAWLELHALDEGATEMSAAEMLESFRRENDLIQGLSFPTISGSGPNGAIVHYRASEDTNRKLEPGTLFLVDSGAQYLDGTTDVTRTIAIGAPTEEMKDRFTRVLKGHIALASAKFPEGTSGSQLDILARAPLWHAGVDFEHGTGHGVGSYLGVHEGPQRISKLPNRVGLKPGMIISNEPGYYKTGEFGIRIENLVAVVEAEPPEASEKTIFGFETLTCAPIDRRLIDRALLNDDEIDWLNNYHHWVATNIGPLLDGEVADWLKKAVEAV